MLKKCIRLIKNPKRIAPVLISRCKPKSISDELYIKMEYYNRFEEELNLSSPVTYNEKIQWLKINDRKPVYAVMADKYKSREFVSNAFTKANKKCPLFFDLLGVWENFDKIDFEALPQSFVLKTTHDSGGIVICKDKNNFDVNAAKKKLTRAMRFNYYYHGRQYAYKNITPCIIAEKYMTSETGNELNDYKIHTFNGEPRVIEVHMDRFNAHKKNIYDTDWNLMPFSFNYPSDFNTKIPKPQRLNEMLEMSKILAKDTIFLRTDFYIINDEIYMGELTFYPANGLCRFIPLEYNRILGDMLKLPILEN